MKELREVFLVILIFTAFCACNSCVDTDKIKGRLDKIEKRLSPDAKTGEE